ncbi:protein of unknown function [Magnetospirillum sp. XM-1]|uniref:DUF6378 domain-containing protein n=1 Tax=Magnetospirillum sp. XM-1 TaxID=1663591 RepID=UPI00073DEC82|nr:DUF6378 domain-containing protein [Magnetospirillum sp. XM-1]CUW38801.1 protein of unknown function [Magnetospirillum sp. XM-1]
MDRKSTLDGAAKAVLQDRNQSYGTPEDCFGLAAKFWTTLFGITVLPHQVALAQDLLKTARIMHNPTHADSWVDKAGYAACGAEVARPVPAPRVVSLQSDRHQAQAPADTEVG